MCTGPAIELQSSLEAGFSFGQCSSDLISFVGPYRVYGGDDLLSPGDVSGSGTFNNESLVGSSHGQYQGLNILA